MSSNTDRPDAAKPAELSGKINDSHDVHVSGECDFSGHAGVEYEITVWVDFSKSVSDMADIRQAIKQAGYEIDETENQQSTDSIRVHAAATTEE